MTSGIELQLVRIIQESLTNVRKHARATSAKIEVQRRPGKLLITVTDDGVGFAQAPGSPSVFPSFGLTTMRERAQSIGAALSVESLPSGQQAGISRQARFQGGGKGESGSRRSNLKRDSLQRRDLIHARGECRGHILSFLYGCVVAT